MFETDLNLDLVIKVAKIYSTLTNMFLIYFIHYSV